MMVSHCTDQGEGLCGADHGSDQPTPLQCVVVEACCAGRGDKLHDHHLHALGVGDFEGARAVAVAGQQVEEDGVEDIGYGSQRSQHTRDDSSQCTQMMTV